MLKLAVLLAAVYVAACVALFVFQRSLIYFPRPRTAMNAGAPRTLAVDGATILITTRAHAGPNAVLYFGGNAEDVSWAVTDLVTAFPNHALFLMHYRGYGGSSGSPSESALVGDAIALFDDVHREHSNIAVVGRSLGSGVAIQLASGRPISRLVLVTPFDSLGTIAARSFPWFPVQWILKDRFESSRYAPRVSAPTLVISAERDEIIPRSSTDALFRSFQAGIASFAVIAGADHNSISEDPEYVRLLKGAP